ncbi:fungal-specific transcription factor domain-containing protein [Xylariaceae sp. FL1019]|nr:fungal-specific transcription factor domain-containing protein [Xylariaceae sp. FL1019]
MDINNLPLAETPASRRREKVWLSCAPCRRRKLKCDHQQPCSSCARSKSESSCIYPENPGVGAPKTGTKPTRIRRLLATPNNANTHAESTQEISIENTPNPSLPLHADSHPSTTNNTPKDSNLSASGTGYRERFHWTSVLTDIHEQLDVQNDDTSGNRPSVQAAEVHHVVPRGILLHQGCKPMTKAELLLAVPPKQTADRLVARYFSSFGEPLCILHRGEFLNQYERFWQDQASATVPFTGLLFSLLCLGAQSESPDVRITDVNATVPSMSPVGTVVDFYREKIVQSLVLAGFSKGGAFIVETMLHYMIVEHYLRKDTDIGVWLVLGNIHQVAIRMGYHRDPTHFRKISVYEGEMRRRVWMNIWCTDAVISTQMGMPTVVNMTIADTAPPLNLLDDDFNADSTSLPPSRPLEELTPVLPLITKGRIFEQLRRASELATRVKWSSYAEVDSIDTQLRAVQNSIPQSLRVKPMVDPPFLVFQRIYLQLLYHKSQILLHQRYLTLASDLDQYARSRETAIEASKSLLRYQHIIHDESKPSGRFHGMTWIHNSLFTHEFLLATSVLCFCVKRRLLSTDTNKRDDIIELLKRTRVIWDSAKALSAEARKASAALSLVLDDAQSEPGADAHDFEGGDEATTPDREKFRTPVWIATHTAQQKGSNPLMTGKVATN